MQLRRSNVEHQKNAIGVCSNCRETDHRSVIMWHNKRGYSIVRYQRDLTSLPDANSPSYQKHLHLPSWSSFSFQPEATNFPIKNLLAETIQIFYPKLLTCITPVGSLAQTNRKARLRSTKFCSEQHTLRQECFERWCECIWREKICLLYQVSSCNTLEHRTVVIASYPLKSPLQQNTSLHRTVIAGYDLHSSLQFNTSLHRTIVIALNPL